MRRFGQGVWFYQGPPCSKMPVPQLDVWLPVFLRGSCYAVSGPAKWNELPFQYTKVDPKFPELVVYNMSRTGDVPFDDRIISFSRRNFPDQTSKEWLVVDLIEQGEKFGWDWNADLEERLRHALQHHALDKGLLAKVAQDFGTKSTQAHIERSIKTPPGPGRLHAITITPFDAPLLLITRGSIKTRPTKPPR